MGSFKNRRKQSKYKQILKCEMNIDCCDEPSKNLMIGNAGLVTGLKYEYLAELFTQYGPVESIVMIPQKSYCFVVYSDVENAVKAYKDVNTRVKLPNMDGPIYLLYAKSVPAGFGSPKANNLPDGLRVIEDFVSCEEEETLLNCINWNDNDNESGKALKHRRVRHYGYEFRYDTNNVDKSTPLIEPVPKECDFIVGRLEKLGHPLPWSPDQLTVNQYQKGQGIPSHIDTHSAFGSPLLSLSLGSAVVMEFRHKDCHVPVLLPRRSLLVMDGDARYIWSHGITPRTMDVVEVEGGLTVQQRGCRTSFTLRRVRQGPCKCQYSGYCDSKQHTHPTIPDGQAHHLEAKYVHEVYSNIANHFSDTRTKIWPNVLKFVKSFPCGSILLDAGCGNGKNFGLNSDLFQVGFDRCVGLTEVTHSRGYEVYVSDCLAVTLRDSVCDGVISIAVLHHLSTRERRLRALHEFSRVLVPGGRALITVWAKDQTKHDKTAYLKHDRKNRRNNSDTISSFKNNDSLSVELNSVTSNKKLEGSQITLPIHTARTEFLHQDVFVPWKVKSNSSDQTDPEVFYRYYHVFEENELYQLCSEITCITVLETYYTEGNWCIIFKKNT